MNNQTLGWTLFHGYCFHSEGVKLNGGNDSKEHPRIGHKDIIYINQQLCGVIILMLQWHALQSEHQLSINACALWVLHQ